MTDGSTPPERPPYRAALVVTLVVLAGYVVSLAPTVTFWDAGEFIAATQILGIPHPPGTPLFVLMGHVWATLLPIGAWAYRTNLMSAIVQRGWRPGCLFLVVHESLAGHRELAREGGDGLVAHWLARRPRRLSAPSPSPTGRTRTRPRSTPSATFIIAASAGSRCAGARRGARERAPVYMLLIVYLQGLSVGNHLLALLVGPGGGGFIVFTLRSAPARDPLERRHEWAKLAAMAGPLGAADRHRARQRPAARPRRALLRRRGGLRGHGRCRRLRRDRAAARRGRRVALPLPLYPLRRSTRCVNEAEPATWDALLAVIRRAQYPPRAPLDDPTVLHGPGNPGRILTIIWLQIQNYLQYCDWQLGQDAPDDRGRPVMQARGLRGCSSASACAARWRSGEPTGRLVAAASRSCWSPGSGWWPT